MIVQALRGGWIPAFAGMTTGENESGRNGGNDTGKESTYKREVDPPAGLLIGFEFSEVCKRTGLHYIRFWTYMPKRQTAIADLSPKKNFYFPNKCVTWVRCRHWRTCSAFGCSSTSSHSRKGRRPKRPSNFFCPAGRQGPIGCNFSRWEKSWQRRLSSAAGRSDRRQRWCR